MPSPGGRDFQQAYYCQAMVDSAHQVIVAAEATNQATGKEQAVAMIEQAIGDTGTVPKEVSAGRGYYSAKSVDGLSALGVDPFIAPERTRHGTAVPPASRGQIPPRDCRPGTGCGGRRQWSRRSDRSSRAGNLSRIGRIRGPVKSYH